MYEPSDLDLALAERHQLIGWPYVGPLTRKQATAVEAYERYCEEREHEHELEQQHGGRTRCPLCDEFAVRHFVVEQRRDPTSVGKCEHCGHVDV